MVTLSYVLHVGLDSSVGGTGGGTKRKMGEGKPAEDAPLVWCNKGLPMRPRTKEDPGARGFMWKWEHRKTVKVVQRGGVPVPGGAVTGGVQDEEGEDYRLVSQDEIRQYEDLVVGVAKPEDE